MSGPPTTGPAARTAARAAATLHAVQLADCPPQPWRNGGGTTRELLRWPRAAADATAEAPAGDAPWRVRVSVAEIARDGPFSPYPGVARWFAVLHGGGVRLVFGREAHTLAAGGPPLRFDGADAPHGHLAAGPTLDLNLMTRAGAGEPHMQRLHAGATIGGGHGPATAWRAVYAHTPLRVATPAGLRLLPAGGLLWSDDAEGDAWRVVDDALAYGMTLR